MNALNHWPQDVWQYHFVNMSFLYRLESWEPATKTGQATRTSRGDIKGSGLKCSRTTDVGSVGKQSAMRRHATRIPNVMFLVCGNSTYKRLQNAWQRPAVKNQQWIDWTDQTDQTDQTNRTHIVLIYLVLGRKWLELLDKNQIARWKLCESCTAVSVLAKSKLGAAHAMQDPTSFKTKAFSNTFAHLLFGLHIYRLGSWVGKLQEHTVSKHVSILHLSCSL